MIQKIMSKLSKTKEVEIDHVINSIIETAKKTRVLNLCALPTEYSWLGVYNAGLSLFPENTIGIPQYYSNQVLSNKQLVQIGELIGSLKFDQLIYNGYNSYFSIITQKVLQMNPSVRVGIIHHGFFAELSGDPIKISILNSIIEEVKAKRIHKIGFLKQGNSEIFQKMFGIPCQLILNKNPKVIPSVVTEPIIGVLTNKSFRKNTATQVVAALSLNDYEVSIFNSNDYDMFDLNNKLVKNVHLSHADFLLKLAQNTINSHVTFSEASGGQVFTESLALGVPCLTSHTHGYLNDSAELTKSLVVERFDDAWAIAEKMKEVIGNRSHLSKLGLEYSIQMDQKSDRLLKAFLES